MATYTIEQIGITRTSANINNADLFEIQIQDGGVNDGKSAKMTFEELSAAINGGVTAKKYKCLLSQNAPIASTNNDTMIAGQIWEASGSVHPSDQSFFDTYELVSGTLYANGSRYRVAVDTPFTFSASAIEYDGSPYIVSTDADGDFNPFVNTLGEISFIYGVTGQFTATSVGLFIQGKTYVNHKSYVIGGVGSGIFTSYIYDDDNIAIYTNLVGGVSADGRLSYEPFEIGVYP